MLQSGINYKIKYLNIINEPQTIQVSESTQEDSVLLESLTEKSRNGEKLKYLNIDAGIKKR